MVESQNAEVADESARFLADSGIFNLKMNNFKIIANWKMNGSKEKVKIGLTIFNDHVEYENQSGCVFCPPSCFLDNANEIISSSNLKLNLGSQDLDADANNPSTGGINGKMLKELGCNYVLIGHSERRIHFNEHEDCFVKEAYFSCSK